jgi:hypothetical protein
LCVDCVHSRVIDNARGSRFYLCRLSERDARFPRYPPLPVVSCAGYEAESPPEENKEGSAHTG